MYITGYLILYRPFVLEWTAPINYNRPKSFWYRGDIPSSPACIFKLHNLPL